MVLNLLISFLRVTVVLGDEIKQTHKKFWSNKDEAWNSKTEVLSCIMRLIALLWYLLMETFSLFIWFMFKNW